MLINLRNALMAGKRLPYDAEVEFLESSGTQYIDTGIVPTTTKTEITFSTPTPPPSGYMCGSFNANKNRYYPAAFSGSSTRYIDLKNAANTVISQYTNDGNVHTVAYNATGGACYFDGAAAGTLDTTTLTASNPIYLFCTSTSTGASGLVSGRIYSCKIYDANGNLLRDYIPVRKGTVGYLYDRVSGKLFGNAGTGDFVLGQDVVPVEYIESTGTQWIDTGLIGRDGYDFEYRFRPMSPLPCGIGGEYDDNKNCCIGLVRSNGNLAYNYYTPNVIVEVQSLTLGTDYNIKAHLHSGEQYFEVNGVRGGTESRTGSFVSNYNLYLFAINNANSPAFNAVMRLHDFTANLNGVPVRSFRPVRVGTEGAMMDVLTRRVYRNAGTGAFTYGNDLKYPIPAS